MLYWKVSLHKILICDKKLLRITSHTVLFTALLDKVFLRYALKVIDLKAIWAGIDIFIFSVMELK